MCSDLDGKCNIEGCTCNEKQQAASRIDKLCSFCDERRTSVIVINDNEMPLCDTCEYKLKSKLIDLSNTTIIPYVPLRHTHPLILTDSHLVLL